MLKTLRALLVPLSVVLTSAAHAAVFIIPDDAELVRRSAAVAIGTVERTSVFTTGDGRIFTRIEYAVEQALKGSIVAGQTVEVIQEGGLLADRFAVVSGMPNWVVGSRSLVFLDREAGHWQTHDMTLGKFDYVRDANGRTFLVRGVGSDDIVGWNSSGARHDEQARDPLKFVRFILATVAGADVEEDALVHRPGSFSLDVASPTAAKPSRKAAAAGRQLIANSHYPPSAYLMAPLRWDLFDRGGSARFFVSNTQPGYDTIGAAQRALAAWTNDPNSNISYAYAGTNSAGFVEDGINTIVYNQASGVPSGAIAYSKAYGGGQHTFKGETFYSITEGDVIVRSGLSLSQAAFDEMVAHELGHTLGFRHSNEGTPSSNDAVMYYSISGRYGASLAPWDQEAASHVYGTGTVTPPPPPPPPSGGSDPGNPAFYFGDYNGDGRSDVLWRNAATGQNYIYLLNGATILQSAQINVEPDLSWRIVGVGDFDGDRRSDILWRNFSTGANYLYFMNGTVISSRRALGSAELSWRVVGVGDFNADGVSDILWRNSSSGQNWIYLMSAGNISVSAQLNVEADPNWRIVATGDFDGDRRDDIFWRNVASGQNYIYFVNGTTISRAAAVNVEPDLNWRVVASGDYNGDGRDDIFWRHFGTGRNVIFLMNGSSIASSGVVSTEPDLNWRIEGSGDFNADGRADVFWRNRSSGVNWLYLMNGVSIATSARLDQVPDQNWQVVPGD